MEEEEIFSIFTFSKNMEKKFRPIVTDWLSESVVISSLLLAMLFGIVWLSFFSSFFAPPVIWREQRFVFPADSNPSESRSIISCWRDICRKISSLLLGVRSGLSGLLGLPLARGGLAAAGTASRSDKGRARNPFVIHIFVRCSCLHGLRRSTTFLLASL